MGGAGVGSAHNHAPLVGLDHQVDVADLVVRSARRVLALDLVLTVLRIFASIPLARLLAARVRAEDLEVLSHGEAEDRRLEWQKEAVAHRVVREGRPLPCDGQSFVVGWSGWRVAGMHCRRTAAPILSDWRFLLRNFGPNGFLLAERAQCMYSATSTTRIVVAAMAIGGAPILVSIADTEPSSMTTGGGPRPICQAHGSVAVGRAARPGKGAHAP